MDTCWEGFKPFQMFVGIITLSFLKSPLAPQGPPPPPPPKGPFRGGPCGLKGPLGVWARPFRGAGGRGAPCGRGPSLWNRIYKTGLWACVLYGKRSTPPRTRLADRPFQIYASIYINPIKPYSRPSLAVMDRMEYASATYHHIDMCCC